MLFRGIVGSRAYGTQNANSDMDVRGIFVVPSAEYARLALDGVRDCGDGAAKFDELAVQKEFKKYLVAIQKPKEKHPECYPAKFGAEGKVKIKKSLGNKVYLWQEDKALRKMITAFGVDVSKFMFVPE